MDNHSFISAVAPVAVGRETRNGATRFPVLPASEGEDPLKIIRETNCSKVSWPSGVASVIATVVDWRSATLVGALSPLVSLWIGVMCGMVQASDGMHRISTSMALIV